MILIKVIVYLYISILLHEFGHFIFIKYKKEKVTSFEIFPFKIDFIRKTIKFKISGGGIGRTMTNHNNFDNILIYLGGPLINFILVLFGFVIKDNLLILINLALLITNLLPIGITDGYYVFNYLTRKNNYIDFRIMSSNIFDEEFDMDNVKKVKSFLEEKINYLKLSEIYILCNYLMYYAMLNDELDYLEFVYNYCQKEEFKNKGRISLYILDIKYICALLIYNNYNLPLIKYKNKALPFSKYNAIITKNTKSILRYNDKAFTKNSIIYKGDKLIVDKGEQILNLVVSKI